MSSAKLIAAARAIVLSWRRGLHVEAEYQALADALDPPPKPRKEPKQLRYPNKANGAHARAAGMSPERRREIAQKAAATRWHKP